MSVSRNDFVGPVARGLPWADLLSQRLFGMQVRPVTGEPSSGQLEQIRLGAVDIFALTGTAQRVTRSAAAVRTVPADVVKVSLMTDGEGLFSQDGNDLRIGPGEFAIYEMSRPYQLALPDARWRTVVLTVPPAALGLPRGVLAHASRQVHRTSGAGRPLYTVLDEVGRMGPMSPSARHRLGVAVTALLTAALADPELRAPHPTLRDEIFDSMTAQLSDPDLSTAQLARRHHVSPRTLQRMFQSEARGVEGMIRDLRLDAVRRDLVDPELAGLTIADLAARWCVTDAAWLSRAFRARYGMSPSQYRRTAHSR